MHGAGEPDDRPSVLRRRQSILCGRSRGRGGHSATGGQHARVAADHPEQCAVRAGHIRGLLERPEPETGAVHAVDHGQRAGSRRRTSGVRLLLLRTAHGGGGPGGGRAHVLGRWPNGLIQRPLQLRQ